MKKTLRCALAMVLALSCLFVLGGCQKEEPAPTIIFSEKTSGIGTSQTVTTDASATTTTTTTTTATVTTTTTTKEPTSQTTSTTTTTGTTTKPTAGKAEAAFPDTLFIGDSRTYGFVCYGIDVPGATFFCAESLNVYTVTKNQVDVPGYGKITLEELLKKKQFKQVYMMFGLNELGSGLEATAAKYQGIIDLVAATQTNAKFIIQSSMHVTKTVSDKNLSNGKVFNNTRIDALNVLLKKLVDNQKVFYVDLNAGMDDSAGALSTSYAAGDGMHIKVSAYAVWRDYLYANRIM